MTKRKLSSDEMTLVAEERRKKEVAANPYKMISVRVEDETNENGDPIVWVHFIGERQSKDWKRTNS